MIDALIGHTPVVRLERVVEPDSAEVWVKLEGMNPGSSIKDRPALAMVLDAEEKGLLSPGDTIVEPTSGNTGIGLAQIAAARGYKLVLCLPSSMSVERKRTLRAYGAELVLTDRELRMIAAIAEAERIRDETGAFLPNQFSNPANPRSHYETTAPELWDGLDGRIDAFVYGSGTGGTISGVGKFLKERLDDVLIVAVEPARSAVMSGEPRGQHKFQGMGPGFIPDNLDRSVIDRIEKALEEDAFPLVRRLAREIGIDINQVAGSGPSGRISADDIKNHSKKLLQGGSPLASVQVEILPDFSKWGEIERKPMSNVRRKTAHHLSYAWATIPHVTQYDKADITNVEKFRKEFGKKVEQAGAKLTTTAILIKIVASALKLYQQFNASVDMANNEIIYKNYLHIGVAVDTERGLLVPVIWNVDQKNIIEISIELAELAAKARDKKISLEEMQGASFTISNLGGLGGTYFSPVINSPEVAILGVSRGKMEPVYIDGEFIPRLMLPLSLSYDHRVIDGAEAVRFLRWTVGALEQPFLISLEG